jgi:hypothetical protein
MPFKDPDPTDPIMLVGVLLPADAEASRDMDYVFAEEFARMGYDRGQLLGLFKTPFYGGAHGAYQQLGETEILSIIDECLAVWGSVIFSILDFGFSIAKRRTLKFPIFPESKDGRKSKGSKTRGRGERR